MRFGILGLLEATDGERLIEFVRPKQRAVLAMLLIEANRVVAQDRLIDLLWAGEPPAWAIGALQVHISGLRAALEPDQPARMRNRFLVTQQRGYLLRVGPDDLDAGQFETLAVRGQQFLAEGRPTAARRVLKEGLALWRGPALAEFAFEPFAQQEAARLEELRATALEDRIEADLGRGAHAAVIAELEALVAERPLRERLWGLLMLALYRSERQTEALRAFARARATLREEIGVDPGPALRRLEDEILSQSPTLDWQPPREHRPSVLTRPVVPEASAADRGVPTGRRGPLVGRDPELAVVRRFLARTHAGRGGIVLVSGEPGIGKTRLVEEVATEATQAGLTVAWGRCHDEDASPPFSPWAQVIRGLLGVDDQEALQRALAPSAAELAQIVPEVKELVPTVFPPAALDPVAARFQLSEAVNRFLAGLAAHRPLAVVLDDLHWADPPSLRLVQFVGARVADTGLLLVATFRDVDPIARGELADVLGTLAREPTIYRASLSGLSEPETRAFIAQTFGVEPSTATTTMVHAQTDGNPFLVAELARLLASEDALGGEPERRTRVPVSVRDVICRRLARLPERTDELLSMAAVLGREVDLPVLALASRIDVDEAVDLLDASVGAGILVEDATVVGRYRFVHALIREAVLAAAGLARRAKLHARAAAALRGIHGNDEARAIELADHLYAATPVVEIDVALAAALRAADVCRDRLEYEDGEKQLRRALELVGRMPPSTERARRELDVQQRLAALLSSTQGYHSAAVLKAWSRALELCAELRDGSAVLAPMWGLARASRSRAEYDVSIQLGRQLLDMSQISRDCLLAIAGHECIGFSSYFKGDLAPAEEHLAEAVRLTDQAVPGRADAGSLVLYPSVTSRVYLASVRFLRGDEPAAIELCDIACRLATEGGHPLTLALALLKRAKLASMAGRPAETDAFTRRCLALAESVPLGHFESVANLLGGWALAVQGEHEDGEACLLRSLADLRASGWRLALTYFHALQADAFRAGGRFDAAMEAVEEGLGIAAATDERYCEAELCRIAAEVTLQAWPERVEPARTWLRRAVDTARAQGATMWLRRAEEMARLTSR